MQKIKALINKEKHVYIILKNRKIAKQFFVDAQAEGVTFSDGAMPTTKATDDMVALLPDGTICYVGWAGRSHRNTQNCICIDYEKYLEGKA